MKVCIFGAGAIGGHVAARLALAGQAEVSLVARGAHLAAIRSQGLTLRNNEGEQWHARIASATDDPASLPPQDIVLVALKSCALPPSAAAIAGLLAEDGVAVFLNNGIPWWWNHDRPDSQRQEAPDSGRSTFLPLLDPDGALWRQVRPERTLGGVVYSPNEIESPGVVVHRSKARNQFIFGTPRQASALQRRRLDEVAALFTASGLDGRASADLYEDIWHKLLVNVAGNPVSALTRLGTVERGSDPALRQLSFTLATEIAAIARAMGWAVPDTLIEEAVAVGKAQSMRPSMLQDVLLARPMEVEALLGQPQAFAQQHGLATPGIDIILALMRGLDRARLA